MIILPSKGRPESLARFVHQYYLTKATLPVWVVLDERDAYRYNGVKLPENWKKIVTTGCLGDIFKKIFQKYPDEAYYAMVADDVFPETMYWDVTMRDACLPDKIVWGEDGIQSKNLPVHPFIGGDLVRRLGWWAAPGLRHWYVDNVWNHIAATLGCGVYLPEVKMTHLHFINGSSVIDRTYREQPDTIRDRDTYLRFMSEVFPDLIKHLGQTKV